MLGIAVVTAFEQRGVEDEGGDHVAVLQGQREGRVVVQTEVAAHPPDRGHAIRVRGRLSCRHDFDTTRRQHP